jgi:hypothetical protein
MISWHPSAKPGASPKPSLETHRSICRSSPLSLWMGLRAWQKEKREAEDQTYGKELQVLEPIGSSVASNLRRDDRG